MKHPLLSASVCLLALAGTGFAQKKIPNSAAANLVLGQDDFVTGVPLNPPAAFSLRSPSAVIVDPVSRKVFVADELNARILRYPSADSLTNGSTAEAVFGQPNFSSDSASGGQQGLGSQLRGLFLDRMGRLWVGDRNNHRVLCFEAAAYRTSHPHADKVIGQPDFATTTSGISASKLNWPQGVWVDSADRLWVADYLNNRVLRFDSISTKANGANADGVIGQTDFVSNTGGVGVAKTGGPVGVSVSAGGALFVGEYNNNRVLRFDNAATLPNGPNASAVLGQPDFAINTAGTSAATMDTVAGVWWTPNDDLWVLDQDNRRVLRFEKASTLPNGSPAKGVVGQSDFTSKVSALTNRGLVYPYYFASVDTTGCLWVPDNDGNRVLRYAPDVVKPKLALTGTVPKTTTKATQLIKGTATDANGISKVQYRVNNGPLKNATGTTSWQFTAALKAGANTITITAIDAAGNPSLPKVVKITRGAASLATR